jgi:hypothetical protein
VLCLDSELAGLRLRESRGSPQLVENVELEIPTQRFLDHRAVGHTGTSRADLHPPQDIFVDRERRSDLRHIRIIASRCSDAIIHPARSPGGADREPDHRRPVVAAGLQPTVPHEPPRERKGIRTDAIAESRVGRRFRSRQSTGAAGCWPRHRDVAEALARCVHARIRREPAGVWSARRGTYRILYRVRDDPREVIVHRVEHRGDVYRPR